MIIDNVYCKPLQLIFLSVAPQNQSPIGITIPNVIVKNANRLFPHPKPNVSYICGAKSGKLKPHIVLMKAPTLAADAA